MIIVLLIVAGAIFLIYAGIKDQASLAVLLGIAAIVFTLIMLWCCHSDTGVNDSIEKYETDYTQITMCLENIDELPGDLAFSMIRKAENYNKSIDGVINDYNGVFLNWFNDSRLYEAVKDLKIDIPEIRVSIK